MPDQLIVHIDPDDKHAYRLETLGRLVLVPKKWWGAIRIEAPDLPPWNVTLGRPRWSHSVWEAVEEDRGVVASYALDGRSLVCGDRQLTMGPSRGKTPQASPWALREEARDIAVFPVVAWGLIKVKFTVVDDEAFRRDPRLGIFAAWCAQKISRI